ncbi:MAG: maleate cis-trans isomerase family protein [Burkholderiales bacterium]
MGFTGRIGLLAPSSNTTVETEFFQVLPKGVTLHVARLFISQVTTEMIGSMVDTLEYEAKLLASADVDIIVLGATAPSFLHGIGTDRKMIERIEAATGKPATTTSTALLEAARALGVNRLALGSPFSPTVNGLCASFLDANGFSVVACDGMNLVDNLQIGRLEVETAYEMGRQVDRPDAEAIVLACTNWRTIDIIERLERDSRKPVLTTSQVTIWDALRKIGYDQGIPGFGRLLRDHMIGARKAA